MNKFSQRINSLRKSFDEYGLDAIFINSPANVSYYTGKAGDDCSIYISADDAFIITDFRYREMALELSDWLTLLETDSDHSLTTLIASRKEKNIGIEEDHLSLHTYNSLRSKIPDKNFVLTRGLTEKLREVKDPEEIEATRRACEIADKTFTHMLDFIKPGLTENECAAELEYFMKKEGASGTSFSTIFISGIKTSMPHGVPGDKKIEKGEFVTMDYGCIFEGYCSDMTRTVAIGSASEEMVNIYNIVYKAQTECCRKIKAGITGKEADSIARDIITAAGYGEYFGHGLGHGTGLEIHESPRYSPGYKDKIKENTIVSIEPGIYLPKKFGVRIEDLALVTKNGIINFISAPKELIIL